MHRTQNRPLVTGRGDPSGGAGLRPRASRWWPSSSSGWPSTCSRPSWPSSATLFYVFVYTLWLKRRSTPEHRDRRRRRGRARAGRLGRGHRQPLVGARRHVRRHLHLDAAALLGPGRPLRGGLQAADVPMLPVVASLKRTTTEIVAYTVALVAVSLLLAPVAHLGVFYVAAAAVLGAGFLCLVGPPVGAGPAAAGSPAGCHAGVRLLDHLPDAAVRGHGRRRLHHASTDSGGDDGHTRSGDVHVAAPASADGPTPGRRWPAPVQPPPVPSARGLFLLVGLVLAAALGVGLFTGVGVRHQQTGVTRPSGDPAPSFSLAALGRVAARSGHRPTAGATGHPAVLLFFASWCPPCQTEIPPSQPRLPPTDDSRGPLAEVQGHRRRRRRPDVERQGLRATERGDLPGRPATAT